MLTQDAIRLGKHPSCQKKPKTYTALDGFTGEIVTRPIPEPDLSALKFKELREIATAKGITVPFGTKTPDLIKLLKGE